MKKFILTALILCFVSPVLAEDYPQFDITGYKKWEFYKLNVNPVSNYFLGQTHLGSSYGTLGLSGPWQERLKLLIKAKLSPDLSVSYDIEQEPDQPQKSDVKVTYGNTELSFGDFQADFSGNEFASTSKYLNGVMLQSKDKYYDLTLVPSSKLRSNTQKLTSQNGNNTRGPYSLGHGGIIEGTEQIWVNEVFMRRGIDYQIDYFAGKVTFYNILTTTDRFKYTYEYTNIIDLFFPTISRRDFVGFRGRGTIDSNILNPPPSPKEILLSREASEDLITDQTWEEQGLYVLNHKPIVMFSENVRSGGEILKKAIDYYIDYNKGELILFSYSLPTAENPISITYRYYETAEAQDLIIGNGSRGPYQTSRQRIISGSEKIYLDGILKFKNLDYILDYNPGKIIFTQNIGPASSLDVRYHYIKSYLPPAPTLPPPAFSLSSGLTYLKESAQKGAGDATATVSENSNGSKLTAENLLNLTYYPLDSGSSLSVSINGVPASAETDYTIPTAEAANLLLPYINDKNDTSNGYATGTLKFLTTLEATSEVTVVYTYQKSVIGKYTGSANGSEGPYYLTNKYAVIPGSEKVQVWDQGSSYIQGYTRNSSKEVSNGDYKINYNYPYTPYIIFTNPLPANKSFSVTFSYVPESQSESQNISHTLTAVDLELQSADRFKIEGAYAVSRTDQVLETNSSSESFAGNSTRGPYNLSNRNLVETSEKISIDGWLLNKDVDYFINYSSGQISFYYLTPSSSNTIQIDYEYQTAGGLAGSTQLKEGKAYKLGGNFNLWGLKLSSLQREVDYDFSAMGGIPLSPGSRRSDWAMRYSPFDLISFSGNIIENNSQLGSNRGYYLWSNDQTGNFSLNPFNLATLGYSVRKYRTLDDILPGSTSRSNFTETNSNDITFNPHQLKTGSLAFSNNNTYRVTDSLNKTSFSSTKTKYYHTSNTLELGDKINLAFDHQYSEPETGTPEAASSHTLSKDTTYNLNWDLTFKPFKRLFSRLRLITHDQKDLITNVPNYTRNESWRLETLPVNQLTANFDHGRQETLSVLLGGDNPNTERTSLDTTFTPYDNLRIRWQGNQNSSLQETGNRSRGTGAGTALSYSPFSYLNCNSNFNADIRNLKTISGTREIETETNTINQNYGLSWSLTSTLNLQTSYDVQYYLNLSPAQGINTNTENTTHDYRLNYTPLNNLTLTANLKYKTTKDLIANSQKPKDEISLRSLYKITNWGTCTYEWAQEKNRGEVLGGVVASLNLEKTSHALTLSSSLPMGNAVVNNLTMSVSWKNVIYADYLNPANNFNGSVVAFEGSLNF